jgi:hypothetical protein
VAAPEWTVERHLEAGGDQGRALWHRFAGARPKGDDLIGYFDVTYQVDDPRIRTVSPYQKDLFVHHFRVSSIDGEFAGWIHDAYEQVGCGRR